MFKIYNVLYILVSLFAASHAAALDFVSPVKCSLWDGNCLKSVVQLAVPIIAMGLPDLGTQVLDPCFIPMSEINHDGLRVIMEDVEVVGLAKAKVQKISVDKYNKQARVRGIVSSLTANSTYKAAGFLHDMPLNGKGDACLRITNLEVDVLADFDIREDGKQKKYVELKDYYYSFEVLDGFSISLTNLYSGDEAKSAAADAYVQKHWKELSAEFGRPLLNPLLERAYIVLKTVLHSLPLDTFISDI